jgi:hypothetical protein
MCAAILSRMNERAEVAFIIPQQRSQPLAVLGHPSTHALAPASPVCNLEFHYRVSKTAGLVQADPLGEATRQEARLALITREPVLESSRFIQVLLEFLVTFVGEINEPREKQGTCDRFFSSERDWR